jgi:hypothetical protein
METDDFPPLIFESPDGGETVYGRRLGESARILISNRSPSLHSQMQEAQLWNEIRKAAELNPALRAAMDEVIMIYRLTKEDTDGQS